MTREEAIKGLTSLVEIRKKYCDGQVWKDEIECLDMAIKALEQEPCEDCISRQALLEKAINIPIAKIVTDDEVICRKIVFADDIENMPSVTPRPKMGYWEVVSDGYVGNAYICECSECKDTVWVYKDADRKWNYCPNCGAKMEQKIKMSFKIHSVDDFVKAYNEFTRECAKREEDE